MNVRVELPSKEIDNARVGISKSLMTSPCERKGYYGETIRDADGRRLRHPMPERVTFGAAVDEATAYIVWHASRGQEWDVRGALKAALDRAERDEASFALVPDKAEFGQAVELAIGQYVHAEDGFARLVPQLDGIRLQGDNGRSLTADDVIGTPDYLLADGSVLDVKTSGKRFYPDKFFDSPEMAVYAYLAAAESGVIPPRLIYQVYVRVTRPYWQWLERPGSADMVRLGQVYAARWRKGLAADDPDLFGVNPRFCGDCGFRDARPELGFAGCEVGQLTRMEEVA